MSAVEVVTESEAAARGCNGSCSAACRAGDAGVSSAAGRHAMRCAWTSTRTRWRLRPRCWSAIRQITAEGLTKYPRARGRGAGRCASTSAFSREQVLLTNGVDEAIHLLCAAFLEEEDEALIATPGFFMYDVSASMMTSASGQGAGGCFAGSFRLSGFCRRSRRATKLIMVASPNNPTGAVVTPGATAGDLRGGAAGGGAGG